jgi:hypothetical protein
VTLAQTQALFHEAVTAAAPLPRDRLEGCFAGTPGLPAAERVAIYAGMYAARLSDGLRQTFPALARFLGEEQFAALAGDYLRRHPSEHHDIGQVGRRLAEFLRRHPDPERPDLADLAELEWTRQEAFFAPPAGAAGLPALAGLASSAFAGARLALSPALRVLVQEHEVAPLWRSVEAGEPPGPPSAARSAVAVWRSGFEVFHGPIALDEAEAVERARAGAPLAEVCAAFAGREDPAAAAHQALSSWLAEGWIAGVGAGEG